MKLLVNIFMLFLLCFELHAATYSLEIIQPQAGLTTANRYYKTYTGFEYKVRLGVIGGLYPYTYSLTTAPTGMTMDSTTGVITWSNPVEAGSPHSITASVTDSESTTVTRSWTLTVSTTGFYFLDAVNGQTVAGGGQGTLASPWKTLDDLLEAGTVSSGTQAFFKTGNYDLTGLTLTSTGTTWERHEVGSAKPLIWLAYPGESPVIYYNSSGYADTKATLRFSHNDVYINGFTISSPWTFGFQLTEGTNRAVISYCSFENLRNGQDGDNAAFIMTTSGLAQGVRNYLYIHNNSFASVFEHTGDAGGAFLKHYSENKCLIEQNTFSNENGDNTANQEGIALKAYNINTFVRKNTIDYITDHSIGGSENLNDTNTIEFNLVRNCGTGEGVVVNEFGTIATREDYYRNTFVCPVTVKNTGTGDGPFYFTNNVIVNPNTTYSGLSYDSVTDPTMIIRTDDLTGVAADGIVDANGALQGTYRTTYLGTRGYETGSDTTAPTLSAGSIHGISASGGNFR